MGGESTDLHNGKVLSLLGFIESSHSNVVLDTTNEVTVID